MGILAQGTSATGAASDAFTWAKTATALSAAGDFTSGLGGMQLANYQAAIASRNAALLSQSAQAAEAAGEYTAQATLEKGGQIAGRQLAGFGASNIDVNIGSPQAAIAATRTVSAMDAAIDRYNAARQAYGLRVEAAGQTAEAGLEKRAGLSSFLSGISGAGSTLLGGAQSIAGKYAGWQLGQPRPVTQPVTLG